MRDPRLLAALAAGLIAAVAFLWGARGLPLGPLANTFVSLPLFAVGFAFGPPAAGLAGVLAAVAVLAVGSLPAALVFVAASSLPAALALRFGWPETPGGPIRPGRSVAAVALLAAALMIVATVLFLDQPGGLSAVLTRLVRGALGQMPQGYEAFGEDMISTIVALKPGALTLWFIALLAVNAVLAARLLGRMGLRQVPAPALRSLRVPGFMVPLPFVGALAASFLAGETGSLGFGLFLILCIPWFLQGLAVVHGLSLGRPGRGVILVTLYLALLLLLMPVAGALTALGMVDHYGRFRDRKGPGLPPPASA